MKGLAVALTLILGGVLLWWKWPRENPGPYELAASSLNERSRESCDLQARDRRLKLARVIDRFRVRIEGLWEAQSTADFPEFKMVAVGPIFLRLSQEKKSSTEFEVTSWSWEEAAATFLKTQAEPDSPETKERWRTLSTALRFLLEKDIGRLLKGRAYLPPDKTEHQFFPRSAVARTGPNEFTVKLKAGDLVGAEKPLSELFEQEWRSVGKRVRVKWVGDDPAAYTVKINSRSARSYVDHREKRLVIANFAWTKTVAHELGHVLGFDDHYYNVWHGENCYYTQESRLADLMSNSERGRVSQRHWELLKKAYPQKNTPAQAFSYVFGR